MIIRNNCFETNSSSTHALCIGKGKRLKPILELLNNYKSGQDYFNTEYGSFGSYNNDGENELLPLIDNKSYKKFINKAQKDYDNKDMYILLSRYTNIGRAFKKYETFHEKLNFIWTTLIYYYKASKDSAEWFTNLYKIDINDVINLFMKHLTKVGFEVYLTDIVFIDSKLNVEEFIEKKYKELKIKPKYYCDGFCDLGTIGPNEWIPMEWINKRAIGKETWGYYPLKEIVEILQDPLLFWNLVLGQSVIYTGSDEWSHFEDLDFSHYKIHLLGGSDSGDHLPVDEFKYKFPKLLGEYKNNNYITKIYSDGTRTRELFPKSTFYNDGVFNKSKFNVSEIDLMQPEFPESIDLKITNYCENNCPFCYAESGETGLHADKEYVKFILNQMKPFTEVAIGGGNPLAHPDLLEILNYAKSKKLICNITVNEKDVYKNTNYLNNLYQNGLVKSIGISTQNPKLLKEALDISELRVNYIIHLILGINTFDYIKEIDDLAYIDKVLILGYKNIGRGKLYKDNYRDKIDKNIKEFKKAIHEYSFNFRTINTISFDNLAIEQLELNTLPDFDLYYQGEDGKFSFYIDAVEQTYAKSSLSTTMEDICYLTLDKCFKYIREVN